MFVQVGNISVWIQCLFCEQYLDHNLCFDRRLSFSFVYSFHKRHLHVIAKLHLGNCDRSNHTVDDFPGKTSSWLPAILLNSEWRLSERGWEGERGSCPRGAQGPEGCQRGFSEDFPDWKPSEANKESCLPKVLKPNPGLVIPQQYN